MSAMRKNVCWLCLVSLALLAAGCSLRVPLDRERGLSLTDKQVKRLVEKVLASVRADESPNKFAPFQPSRKPEEELAEERRRHLLRLAYDKGAPAREGLVELLDANIPALTDEIMGAVLEARSAAFAPVLLDQLGALDKERLLVWVDVAYKLDVETTRGKLIDFISDEEADGQLRLAAVRTAAAFFDPPDAVEVMIGALARSRDKPIREELFDKLQEVTGADIGRDVAAWQRWWRENRSVPPQRWLRDKIDELQTLLGTRDEQYAQDVEKMTALLREALPRVGADGKEKVLALALALEMNVAEVRALAAREAGKAKIQSASEKLTLLVEDSDAGVRQAAVWALGEIEAVEARTAITAALRRDTSAPVRAAAAEALGKLGQKQSVANLLQALRQDEDAAVRNRVAASLRKFNAAEAAPIIAEMLGKETLKENREEFLRTLGAFGDKATTEVVMALLWGDQRDDEARVRWAAADALGKIGDERAIDVLAKAMDDPDQRVREAAVIALKAIGTSGALNALLAKLPGASDDAAATIWKAFKAGALSDPDGALEWAQELARRKLEARSVELLEELVRRADAGGPASFEVLRAGAIAADRVGKDDEFRRLAEAALDKTGDDVSLWRKFLSSLMDAKKYDAAWDAYDRYATAVKDAGEEAIAGQVAILDALVDAQDLQRATTLYKRLERERLDDGTRERLAETFSGKKETDRGETPTPDEESESSE